MFRLLDLVVSAYSLGLIVYALLGWLPSPKTVKARAYLGRFYDPVLRKLRSKVKPVPVGGSLLDVTPAILLVGLMVLKSLVEYFLPKGL